MSSISAASGSRSCTDGVGSKAIVAQMMGKYDTIGIDCVAMNVNDLLCVGARPVSMVDYIAIDRADAAMLDGIAIGLAEGARQAGISISGGEISQLPDVVRGFDLVGTAVGTVALDRIMVGRDIVPGDRVIGIASNGIHSNGFTLARRAFFEQRRRLGRSCLRRARPSARRGVAAPDLHLRAGDPRNPRRDPVGQGADPHHRRRAF